jgi:hypothetical protein
VTGARGNTTRQLHNRRTASDGRAHRFTGARTNTTRGCAGRGGLQRWPDAIGGRGPRKPPLGARANRSWLLSCRLSLTRRLHPMSRLSEPLRTTPRTKQCQLPEEKGSDPFFKGLILRTSRHAPVRRLLQRRTARDGQHSDGVGA